VKHTTIITTCDICSNTDDNEKDFTTVLIKEVGYEKSYDLCFECYKKFREFICFVPRRNRNNGKENN